jgi:hypothetical protein
MFHHVMRVARDANGKPFKYANPMSSPPTSSCHLPPASRASSPDRRLHNNLYATVRSRPATSPMCCAVPELVAQRNVHSMTIALVRT